MPLTPQEESQIRKEAEKKYPEIDAYGITLAKRSAYISGRTEEREAAKSMAIGFGEWLNESNWGEKETWGRHDPPSMPTMEELFDIYNQK